MKMKEKKIKSQVMKIYMKNQIIILKKKKRKMKL